MTTPGKLLTTKAAAAALGVTIRTLLRWRKNRQAGVAPQGPRPVKIGHHVYYRAVEVRRYGLVGEDTPERFADEMEAPERLADELRMIRDDEPQAPLLPLVRVPMPR